MLTRRELAKMLAAETLSETAEAEIGMAKHPGGHKPKPRPRPKPRLEGGDALCSLLGKKQQR